MYNIDMEALRTETEANEKWIYWTEKLPFLHFDNDCEVRISPPWGGAIVRFSIRKGKAHVSVYFDAYSKLGYMVNLETREPIPYWEIYPDAYGETRRYFLGEEDEMLSDIRDSLNQRQ